MTSAARRLGVLPSSCPRFMEVAERTLRTLWQYSVCVATVVSTLCAPVSTLASGEVEVEVG